MSMFDCVELDFVPDCITLVIFIFLPDEIMSFSNWHFGFRLIWTPTFNAMRRTTAHIRDLNLGYSAKKRLQLNVKKSILYQI